MQFLILAAAALAVFSVVAFAVSPAQEQADGPPAPPPELKQLERFAGEWDAVVEMMGQKSKGRETCTVECGGNWLVTRFDGEFMGQPFQGRGLTGFDASTGAFAGVWVDSSGAPMTLQQGGKLEGDGKRLVYEVDGMDMSGKPGRFRHVTNFESKDARVFEIAQILPGGKSETQMTIRYARRK